MTKFTYFNVINTIKNLAYLDFKKSLRSSYLRKTMPLKAFIAIVILCICSLITIFGFNLFPLIAKLTSKSPISIINGSLIFWIFFDILFRYFLQQLPYLRVLPLMTLPIKRSTIIHYVLVKSLVSVFNFLPLLIIIPFCISLLKNGANFLNVFGWFTSLFLIILFNNFLNFLIKKSNVALTTVILSLGSLIVLEYFELFSISNVSAWIFNAIYQKPYASFLLILLPTMLYLVNCRLILNKFYIDSYLSSKERKNKQLNLYWIDALGEISPFLKNDLKLIIRNSKPKQYALISFTFLLYGLTVFNSQQIILKFPVMLVFTSVLMTGGFLFSFGQLIPSWDSSYYTMLMCQNSCFRTYLKSKWYLLSLSIILFFILSLPYLYLGFYLLKILLASALFNIGLNVSLTLLIGSLNRKTIELNTNIEAFETNEFNSVQIFFVFFKLVLPIIIFYPPYKLFNFDTGLFFLAISGIIGIIFKDYVLTKIEKTYSKQKYKTIKAFSEKN